MGPTIRQTTLILIRFLALIFILASPAGAALAQEPSSGPLSRLLCRLRHQHGASAGAVAPVAAAPLPSAQAAASYENSAGSDPYGFAAILNRIRAAAGLHPLAYDPDLSSWASQNNAAQCRWGIGHHINPCGVQNCGWNYADASAVAQGWMNSPGHRENLLSPSVSRFGLAFGPGPYWTFNAR